MLSHYTPCFLERKCTIRSHCSLGVTVAQLSSVSSTLQMLFEVAEPLLIGGASQQVEFLKYLIRIHELYNPPCSLLTSQANFSKQALQTIYYFTWLLEEPQINLLIILSIASTVVLGREKAHTSIRAVE